MNFDGFELPEQDPCFFCEVVRNGKPGDFVEETDAVIARVNSRQFLEGQSLVAPKRHAPTVFDLTESEMIQVLEVARRVGRALSIAVDAEGLLIYQNNGVASLQEVPHFHLHVVPQWKTTTAKGKFPPHIARAEGVRFDTVTPVHLTSAQIRGMTARIRANMEGRT